MHLKRFQYQSLGKYKLILQCHVTLEWLKSFKLTKKSVDKDVEKTEY